MAGWCTVLKDVQPGVYLIQSLIIPFEAIVSHLAFTFCKPPETVSEAEGKNLGFPEKLPLLKKLGIGCSE